MAAYYILALDGGGIRGVLTAMLLERLEEQQPGFLKRIDLVAGTSTGGLLALALASGVEPQTIRSMYEEQGRYVFADTKWDNFKDLGTARGAQYSNTGLKKSLEKIVGDSTLGDLEKRVLISSFDLDNEATGGPDDPRSWKPKFFHNFPHKDSDVKQLVLDVALRTSAAPVYFPTYQGYIDGGLVANNPSMCALAQALDEDTGGQKVGDIVMLSLGTGRNPKYIDVENADWGWYQWVKQSRLLDILMEGSMGVADYQSGKLLGESYHRLDPQLPRPIALDGVDDVWELKRIAEEVDLSETIEWMQKHFQDG